MQHNYVNSVGSAQDEVLTSKYIMDQISTGSIKMCPRGCMVEKISGCNYIECTCGTKFCWNCGKSKGATNTHMTCAYGNSICNSH